MPQREPESFGHYTLIKSLGVGGMAEVFLARTQSIDGFERLVALKRLHSSLCSDKQLVAMMADEARLSVWLTHPNIVQVLDFGQVKGTYYITMEYVEGCDLSQLIKKVVFAEHGALPIAIGLYIILRITEALDFAHQRRNADGERLVIVHRDVSPQNILISFEGQIKLTDFGLARASISIHQSADGIIRGKFPYMPKEQAYGLNIDHRVDIFATGVTLYESLTGVKPFTSQNLAQQLYQLDQPIRPPSSLAKSISPRLDRVVLKAISPDPKNRYQNAYELADDLHEELLKMSNFQQEERRLVTLINRLFERPPDTQAYSALAPSELPVTSDNLIGEEIMAVRRNQKRVKAHLANHNSQPSSARTEALKKPSSSPELNRTEALLSPAERSTPPPRSPSKTPSSSRAQARGVADDRQPLSDEYVKMNPTDPKRRREGLNPRPSPSPDTHHVDPASGSSVYIGRSATEQIDSFDDDLDADTSAYLGLDDPTLEKQPDPEIFTSAPPVISAEETLAQSAVSDAKGKTPPPELTPAQLPPTHLNEVVLLGPLDQNLTDQKQPLQEKQSPVPGLTTDPLAPSPFDTLVDPSKAKKLERLHDEAPTIQRNPDEVKQAFQRSLEEQKRIAKAAPSSRKGMGRLVFFLWGVFLFCLGLGAGWYFSKYKGPFATSTTQQTCPPPPSCPRSQTIQSSQSGAKAPAQDNDLPQKSAAQDDTLSPDKESPDEVIKSDGLDNEEKSDSEDKIDSAKDNTWQRFNAVKQKHRKARRNKANRRVRMPTVYTLPEPEKDAQEESDEALAPNPAPKMIEPSFGYLAISADAPAVAFIDNQTSPLAVPAKRLPLSPGVHIIKVIFTKTKKFSPSRQMIIRPGGTHRITFYQANAF